MLAGLIGVVLLSSGCVATSPLEWVQNGFKVGPNYCRPPAPVAEEWIQASDPKVESRHLVYGAWWNVFQDPTLNSLIETAYANNLNLRVAAMRVLEARGQQAIAAGNFFPQTQQATGGYSRVGMSRNTANNPSYLTNFIAPSTLNSIPAYAQPTNFYSEWQAGFNLSWELDFWGRLRRAIESANANLDASTENFDDVLVTLLADVATNYVQFRIAQQRIKIARDNVRIQEGVLALVEEQFKVGINKVTKLDVDQAKTILEQTRSSIPALQIVQGQANDVLCILLGVPPHDLEPKLGRGWRLPPTRSRTCRTGLPWACRPTWCAAVPTSAPPSARQPPRAPRSALPKPTCTPPSPSTARSVTKLRTWPSCSVRAASSETSCRLSSGTS